MITFIDFGTAAWQEHAVFLPFKVKFMSDN